ncbi:hypothetical protein IFM89_002862 [Coptis chinensis]|uniref:Phytocyanin domain-containing protein n=1 Tax=Coptis chinensis TaxID=261450 RepID=A0A835H3X6_9MAGN|nr:hypothetical protein IFM89_002862 [Coptis chinensis]
MAIAAAFLAFLLVLPAAYAVDYIVGDSAGWNQGTDYTTWVSGKTFSVGDRLLFNYGSLHSVDEVNKADYDSCTSGNALQSYNGGNTMISLNKIGPVYFLCPTFGHCSGGMKLGVTVSAASTTPNGSPPTTPSTTTPTPTTPSPRTSGASINLYNMDFLVLGAITFAPLVALMG